MLELAQSIPDVEVLLSLEPEELGAKIIFLLRKCPFPQGRFHLGNLMLELWPRSTLPGHQTPYPREREPEVDLALSEAWAWLQAQGLVVPAADAARNYGWFALSRRAKRFESETEFSRYAQARMLPREVLHQRIAEKVWMAFMRGDFDTAAFQAMKAVEVSVREASGLGDGVIGVKLMRDAFKEGGKLADGAAEAGERTARMELFAGAIGSYKNPHSHRDVDLNDPVEAVEIVLLANHLLRIVDERARANSMAA